MKISDDDLPPDSRKLLFLMAKRLLDQANVPLGRYDDDWRELIEDVVQEAFVRVLEMEDEPVRNLPGLLNRVMRFIIFEKRREIYRHQAYLGRHIFSPDGGDNEEAVDVAKDFIASPSPSAEEELQVNEFQQAVDQHLWKIIEEECALISTNPCFATFVKLQWQHGYSGNEAWKIIERQNPGRSRAGFFRDLGKLRVAVIERWLSLGVGTGGGI